MNTIRNIINEIQSLEGANVKIFGQNHTLPNTLEKFEIDICDFLEELRGLEEDLIIEVYNAADDDYEEIETDSVEKYLDYLEENFGLKEIQASNSYNWSAPVSHHFNFRIYKCLDSYYMVLSVHKYGDIRGNYTDDVLLKFDNENELQEKFYENVGAYKSEEIEIDDDFYEINVDLWREEKEVYTIGGRYICSTYEYEEDFIIEDIKENI